jgi:uncharacterized protein (DUF1800 family)
MQLRPRDPVPRASRQGGQLIEHLLRRAGFGASPAELVEYADLGFGAAVAQLVDYEAIPDAVDGLVGKPGFVQVTTRNGQFTPSANITDARQRWLFRMIHSRRPLQEKMALFWHNHFATAVSKVAGALGNDEGARYMAAKPSEDATRAKGQLELFREFALGNFRDLLIAVAKDTAMLVWLDGRTNVKGRPQENFARELMELFTMGVDTFAESDVLAGARVFTGWNLARVNNTQVFSYVAAQHDTGSKTFTFAVLPDGNKTIPARSADAGIQDGLDLINAVARHPATGPRLARKLYNYFISEVGPPDQGLISELAQIYYASNFEIRPVVRHLLQSAAFADPANRYARYSWPAEFVVRSIKEVGWTGFAVSDALVLTPMIAMGQQLFEPPDVSGWELGPAWFSSGGMLARMNFAASLTSNQKFNLRNDLRGTRTPEALVAIVLDRLTAAPYDPDSYNALLDYTRAGGQFTGTDAQIATKGAGLAHLIVGSGEYQLV